MSRLHSKKYIAYLLLVSLLVTQCFSYAKAEEGSVDDEEERIITEEIPAVDEEQSSIITEEIPAVDEEQNSIITEEIPAVDEEQNSIITEEIPAVDEEQNSIITEEIPAVDEEQNSILTEEIPVVDEEQSPILTDEIPVTDEGQNSTLNEDESVIEEEIVETEKETVDDEDHIGDGIEAEEDEKTSFLDFSEQPQFFSLLSTSGELTLENAKELKDAQGLAYLEETSDGIKVNGQYGFIVLSQINSAEYYNKTITLTRLGQETTFDLTTEVPNLGYSYQGLGSEEYPFQGIVKIAEGSEKPFVVNRPIFNVLSPNAILPSFVFELQKTDDNTLGCILLAQNVKRGSTENAITVGQENEWNVEIKLTQNSEMGGLIGTLETGEVAKLTANITGTGKLTCENASGSLGFFCCEMKEGSIFSAIIKQDITTTIEIVAGSGDAGGFVGTMENEATLKIDGLLTGEIYTKNGNAGGIVGKANNVSIDKYGSLKIALYNLKVYGGESTIVSGKGAGGIVGEYTFVNKKIDLENFSWQSDESKVLTLGSANKSNRDCKGGSVYGVFINKASYTFTPLSELVIASKVDTTIQYYGGLFGEYRAVKEENGTLTKGNIEQALYINGNNKLTIKSVMVNRENNWGGLIGYLPYSAYVQIEYCAIDMNAEGNIKTNTLGGLIARAGESEHPVFLNLGNVKIKIHGSIENNYTLGGLVGSLMNGIIRLHGTTDLSEFALDVSTLKSNCGQLVGENVDGLVYAVGNGNDENTWLFHRYDSAIASDIGTWGSVLRLDGVKLKEVKKASDDLHALLLFDETGHTVSVLGTSQQNNSEQTWAISSERDFAAYAVSYNYGRNTSPVLQVGDVVAEKSQTVSITNDIDLSGTGIFGIGRDDTKRPEFQGKIEGNNKTVTLDIGYKPYGVKTDNSVGCGDLRMYYSSSKKPQHQYLGLIASCISSTTVSNLKLEGGIKGTGLSLYNDTPNNAASLIASSSGIIKIENVTVNTQNLVDGYVRQAGFIGSCNWSNSRIDFTNCNWKGTLQNRNYISGSKAGGFIAFLYDGNTNDISVSCSTIGGKIKIIGNEHWYAEGANVGGLFAELAVKSPIVESTNKLELSGLVVDGLNISCDTTKGTNFTSVGGFLGYKWDNIRVKFSNNGTNPGVMIKNSIMEVPKSGFGGLVYQATGYWDITEKQSIIYGTGNSITGSTTKDNPSGMLVCKGIDPNNTGKALYMEVGSYGTEQSAYFLSSANVILSLNGESTYFDELVGYSIVGSNYFGNSNGVVSIATDSTFSKIDIDNVNTYTRQLDEQYENPHTRYYYNLGGYRKELIDKNNKITFGPENLDSEKKVLLWSVSQQAANNIRHYFCKNSGNAACIQGTIDLSGYSYYPVNPLKSVSVKNANLVFAYQNINIKENTNKPLSNANRQHYLMHYGLLGNINGDLSVDGLTISGNVGMVPDGTSVSNIQGPASGALLIGSIQGNKANNDGILALNLKNISLNGLYVNGVTKETTYAPLLINKIVEAVTVNVQNIQTTGRYDSRVFAATSLLGEVGNTTATKLKLVFSDMALDARRSKGDNTFVYNDGVNDANHTINYYTYRSVFTRATFIESFRYKDESSGTYNFVYDTNKITYGCEISNTGSGRNPGKQYFYYDKGSTYVWDGIKPRESVESKRSYFSTEDYLPYVARKEEGDYKEIDVNLHGVHLVEGCGTYGDPYIISSGEQLVSVANYLKNASTNSLWGVCINLDVYNSKKQHKDWYHLQKPESGEHTDVSRNTVRDTVFFCEGVDWYKANADNSDREENPTSEITKEGVLAYLRNAYYLIDDDITISDNDYIGLGGPDAGKNAFSGVIIGKKSADGNSDSYPTITISITKSNIASFGGLICYSQGSVVKDVNILYAGTTPSQLIISNSANPGTQNNPFFGGVIGYCMGGDTVIDNVTVEFGENTVAVIDPNLDNDGNQTGYARLVPVGGYVGLIGGFDESDGSEKKGGGVVFRNMAGMTNPFKGSMAEKSGADSTYFYYNPFVGRVLDGYACYEGGVAGQSVLDNTNKNYTIPNIVTLNGTNDLVVSKNDDIYQISVNSEQGLWLLSAIVNSGASAMDANSGKYTDYNYQLVYAYHLGKPRTCEYNKVGLSGGQDDLLDENYWGGTETDSKGRISRLVQKYSIGRDGETFYAACLTGSRNNDASQNSVVTLEFSKSEINMAAYGNGFRGIGASYCRSVGGTWAIGYVLRRCLLLGKISASKELQNVKIILDMSQKEYQGEAMQEAELINQGTSLFMGMKLPEHIIEADSSGNNVLGCKVSRLSLSGTVEMKTYSMSDGTEALVNKNYASERGTSGFVSTIYCADQNGKRLIFDDVLLENLIAGGTENCGGLVGTVGTNQSLTLKNVKTQNLKITLQANNTGSVGGLIGLSTSGGSIIIQDTKMSNLDIYTKGVQYVGGLIGCSKCEVFIKNTRLDNEGVNAEGTKIVADVNKNMAFWEQIPFANVGGFIGCVYETNASITNGSIVGSEVLPVKVLNCMPRDQWENSAGGLIGYTYTNNENGSRSLINVENLRMMYAYVLSGDSAGGIVGVHRLRYLNIRNTVLGHSVVATANQVEHDDANGIRSYDAAGSLVGNTFNYINGYNILLDNMSVGYASFFGVIPKSIQYFDKEANDVLPKMAFVDQNGASIIKSTIGLHHDSKDKVNYSDNTWDYKLQLYDSITSTNELKAKYIGRWVGNYRKDIVSRLVAVCIKGGNLPRFDAGQDKTSKIQAIYANYLAEQQNTSLFNSAEPWLNINPINTSFKISGNNSSYYLTGNGVALTKDNDAVVSLMSKILNENVKKDFWKTYGNLPIDSNASEMKCLLTLDSDFYMTTYQQEEGNGTKVPGNIDFPLAVINTIDDNVINNMLWILVGILTNAADGNKAKANASSIQVGTYKWDGTNFVQQENASLTYDADNKTVSFQNVYDNMNDQFTLVDVIYTDPTNSTNEFHLYIPLLVKKILPARVTIRMLEGTNYYSGDYTNNVYVTAGFEDKLTAFIEINIKNTREEWQKSLDTGANLLWSYQKRINLIENGGTKLPAGTKMILVDRQSGKIYTHTLTDSDQQEKVDLATLFGSATNPWEDTLFCDLLAISAEEDPNGLYVKTIKEKGDSTVRVVKEDGTYTYYRLRTETDEEIPRYTLTTHADVGEDGYLKQGDGYYLTMSIPKVGTTTAINNALHFPMQGSVYENKLTPTKKTKAPPTILDVVNDKERMFNRYIIYDSVDQQSFTLGTKHINKEHPNGADVTAMKDGESIRIELSTQIQVNEEQKLNFSNYTPKEMYQQFEIQLLKYDTADGSGKDVAVGADSVDVEYQICDNSNNIISSTSYVRKNVQGKDKLIVGGVALPLAKLKATGTLNIVASVTLHYSSIILQDFPQSDKAGQIGIGVIAKSSIANAVNTLDTSTKKLKAIDKDDKRYYTQVASDARLVFDTLQTEEGIITGDKNVALGVNPNDEINRATYLQALGRYEYINVSDAILKNAKKIRYTLTLYQKNQDSTSYSDEALALGTYWSYFEAQSEKIDMTSKETQWSREYDFAKSPEKVCSLPVKFSIISGADFETAGLMYSNYKVNLEVVLLDEQGTPLAGTEATDFLIYTNARVYTHLISANSAVVE